MKTLKLSKKGDGKGGISYWFYCPGCKLAHRFVTKGNGLNWTFNGDMELPSFTPSLFMQHGKICHLYLTDGDLIFCTDSQHDLAGKTIGLPELPDWI